jgi:Fe-S cluster assembly protein SufB
VKHPLQAYFRINAENFGQFERTLIIADEGAELTYMEGCTAPKFNTATLHSAVVELVALKGAKIQYITVQNWSNNVFNLVTKRGLAHEEAEVKWIDCNIGSRLTMKYPGVVMKGRKARGEVISIALAGTVSTRIRARRWSTPPTKRRATLFPKHLDRHRPRPPTGDSSMCRSISKTARTILNAMRSHQCQQPHRHLSGDHSPRHGNAVQHEASVSQVSAEQIFYMQQRGLTEAQAMSLSVNGFVNDLVRQFPMEYSVELKRLIELEMEGSVG